MSAVMRMAQGRWQYILPLLGVDASYLKNRHGPCPLCKGGKDRFRFDDKDGNGTWYCNRCKAGNGLTMLMRIHGWDFYEAATEVENLIPGLSGEVATRDQGDKHAKAADKLNLVRQEAMDASQVLDVVRYLRTRKLIVPPGLQAHPGMAYYHEGKRIGEYPVMLGRVVLPSGKPITYHRTYVQDGRKASVPGSAKKVMTPASNSKGGAVHLWPAGPVLGIAEGIETAIAAHMLFRLPVWSVLNANGMTDFQVPDGVREVVVFGDTDKSFTGQAAAYAAAKRFVVDLGLASRVELPPAGDWADVLLQRKGAA